MADIICKLLIIGAGPGGYVCAIRAGHLGVDTVLVDAAELGGTCLNVGCIPSKALIHAANEFANMKRYAKPNALGLSLSDPAFDLAQAVAWKDGIVTRLTGGVGGLLKRAKVRTVAGSARFRDGKTIVVDGADGSLRIRAENIVIATGAVPMALDDLPFGTDVLDSTDALSLEEVPRRLAVVGGGYIGLEIGTAFAKLGAAVTIVEAAERILPHYDASLTAPVVKRLEKLGVEIHLGAIAGAFADGHLEIVQGGDEATTTRLPADKVLVTVGRRPNIDGVGLDELDLTMAGPFIEIDERCRTSMRGVYAIGDVTGEPMLAHRAMAQGELVAEIVAGKKRVWDKRCIPAVCFTDPELVTVGLTAERVPERDIEATTTRFSFQANGRALTLEREDGFVEVTARKGNGVILGVQAVGAGVSELSAAFALAIEMGARVDDVAAVVHAHPTLSEGFQEACLKAAGYPLHM